MMMNNNSLLSNSGIIATRTPNRARRKSLGKNDKFEFDAPQFEDFTQPRYHKQRKLLEAIVLPPEQRTSDWVIEPLNASGEEDFDDSIIEDGIDNKDISSRDDCDDDEWFQRPHFEHEPSTPNSPIGPLISPLPTPNAIITTSASKYGSPLVERTPQLLYSPSNLSSNTDGHNNSSAKQSLLGNGFCGLKSKPLRVLMGASEKSRASSAASSLQFFYPEMAQVKSPTKKSTTDVINRHSPIGSNGGLSSPFYLQLYQKSPTKMSKGITTDTNRWKVSIIQSDEPRTSGSIERSLLGNELELEEEEEEKEEEDKEDEERDDFQNRKSYTSIGIDDDDDDDDEIALHSYSIMEKTSLPISTNWSSIPETPPIMTLLMDHEKDRKRFLPKDSPMLLMRANDDNKQKGDTHQLAGTTGMKRFGLLASKAVRIPTLNTITTEIGQGTAISTTNIINNKTTIHESKSFTTNTTTVATDTTIIATTLKETRVLGTTKIIQDEVLESLQQEQQQQQAITRKPISPAIKRVKVDARFCPAPPISRSRPTSPIKPSVTIPKRDKPVKIDDLKKLLAAHNQKLRPQAQQHNNITRRR